MSAINDNYVTEEEFKDFHKDVNNRIDFLSRAIDLLQNDAIDKIIETRKKETPNCTKCKWSRNYTYLVSNIKFFCGAQANKDAEEVYGNDFCFSLYEPKGE